MACCNYGGSGDCMVLLAATLAIELARGRTATDIGLLSAFFTALADNLALISVNVICKDEDNQS